MHSNYKQNKKNYNINIQLDLFLRTFEELFLNILQKFIYFLNLFFLDFHDFICLLKFFDVLSCFI